jgi:hypothetical protein
MANAVERRAQKARGVQQQFKTPDNHVENAITRRAKARKYEEPFYKAALRTAYQVPSGIAQGYTYPLDLLNTGSQAFANNPDQIQYARELAESEGIDFNEQAYRQATQQASEYFPTQGNLERVVEEQTGLPLQPKTRLQKGIKYASTIGKFAPGNYTQKGLIGAATEFGKEALQGDVNIGGVNLIGEGIGEPAAEALAPLLLAPLLLGPAGFGRSFAGIGKKTKPSGLTERRFEGAYPTELSQSKINKINSKVENDFKQIAEKIIADSPIAPTYSAMKDNVAFKSEAAEFFPVVEELAEQIPGKFSTDEIKKALTAKYQSKEKNPLTPGDYDKSYRRYMKEMIRDTKLRDGSAKDLVLQYRLKNKELTEYFKPGESKAINRAKRDALLDYNRVIAEIIQSKYPGTEFSNLFQILNKQWSDIKDVEHINDFLNDLFNGKINYSESKKALDGQYKYPFQRALGNEGYEKFKQLNKDMLSQEQSYKLIKKAENQGFMDFGKKLGLFLVHPNLAKAKGMYDLGVGGVKWIYKAMLDKPRLAFIWEEGIQAAKQGQYAKAEMKFEDLKREAGAVHPDEIITPPKASKQQKQGETVNARAEPVTKDQKLLEYNPKQPLPTKEQPKPKETPPSIPERPKNTLQHKDKGVRIATTPLPNPETKNIEIPETRGKGVIFHGSPNEVKEPSHGHYSSLNYYGQGFYTTDALDIAEGYSSRRGKASNPTIYEVSEKKPVKLFDMEKPIPEKIKKELTELNYHEAIQENLSSNKNQTLRELYDEMRESGISADEIQEEFDTIARKFEKEGYGGFRHEGGRLTGKKPHEVKIYFNPEETIEIKKIDKNNFKINETSKPKKLTKEEEAHLFGNKKGVNNSESNSKENIDKIQVVPSDSKLKIPLKKLPEYNYIRPLKHYTDHVYREVGFAASYQVGGADTLIPGSTYAESYLRDIHTSNTPELAIGQGKNKGILLKIDSSKLEGKINKSKPAWELLWDDGEAEFIVNANQDNWWNSVQEIIIKPDLQAGKMDTAILKTRLHNLERAGWKKSEVEDGTVRYLKPDAEPMNYTYEAPAKESETPKLKKTPESVTKKVDKIQGEFDKITRKIDNKRKLRSQVNEKKSREIEKKSKSTARIEELHGEIKSLIEEREKIQGNSQKAIKQRSPLNIEINKKELELSKLVKDFEPKLIDKPVRKNDISPKQLKTQRDYIIDRIDEALKKPTDALKLTIDVPGDGVFRIWNIEEILEKFKKKVKKDWPVKQLPKGAPKGSNIPPKART